MRSILEIFTQGGQTEIHKLRMIRQVIGTTLFGSFLITITVFIISLFWHGWEPIYYLAAYHKANYRKQLSFLPKDFYDASWIKDHNNKWIKESDERFANHWQYKNRAITIHNKVVKNIHLSMIIFCGSIFIFSCYWFNRGSSRQKTKILKGYKLVTPNVLKKEINKIGASNIKIADIPLPINAECEHIMIAGMTGSGKTNAIHGLLQQIKALEHKAIIVDTSGGFVSRFFDPKHDQLLNPFDARTSNWDLWEECSHDYEFVEFAESLIPSNQYDPFWTKAAQQVFATAAIQTKNSSEKSIQKLLQNLLAVPLEQVYATLKDTWVTSYVNPDAEKMALSIIATLGSALQSLKYLTNKGPTFSINHWLSQPTGGWLFLSALPTQREVLKPLMSAWFSIAVKSLMGLGENRNRRIWFIIDELAALNKLPILAQALAEVRKFGGCCVLGFQDLQQLDTLYGVSTARTLGSLTGTKIVFRLDSYGAKQMAELFGTQEILEPNRSISFGAHQMRDGVSLTEQHNVRYLVTPTDLMRLDNLEAFIKFPRNLDVSKLKFKFYNCPEMESEFTRT